MIFRVDHFLSDELVRRVMTLRFLNRVNRRSARQHTSTKGRGLAGAGA